MSAPTPITVVLVHPELLGTYGDGGNAVVLLKRLQWRGLAAEVLPVPLGQPVPAGADVYVLGGGEDEAQTTALSGLRGSPGLAQAVARGAPVLAVCAGLQLLGGTVELADGRVLPGLGLLDVATTRLAVRAVGEVLARVRPELGLGPLTGFENHGGATSIGPDAAPLAVVVSGVGNGDQDRTEGVVQAGVVGTYLHGPVLARNPDLADLLLERAVGSPLPPLPLPAVDALREERLDAARQRWREGGTRTGTRTPRPTGDTA
jgi:lipid II isoglutaminyl synthase (glutamine-hydrolysing)